MFEFLKNHTYPIGVDIEDDAIKLVQLGTNGNGVVLIAAGSEKCPEDIPPGSAVWQRWAIEMLRRQTMNGKFAGKYVTAAIPAGEVFIEHIKMPKVKDSNDSQMEEAVISKIKQRLPFEVEKSIIKYIAAEDDNMVVIATERKKIDRYLAIYEKANLQIQSMSVWPTVLINIYVKFFGRRKSDLDAVVMLLDTEPACTNVVICRHRSLLFARSIPLGTSQLATGTNEVIMRLVLELTACKRQLSSMYKNAQIERTIFISGQALDKDICMTIAKQLELPAHIGDCLAAVEISDLQKIAGINRRDCRFSWATAFGLSLL
jgi:Tfp pilus assembly PilM family ATPase